MSKYRVNFEVDLPETPRSAETTERLTFAIADALGGVPVTVTLQEIFHSEVTVA